jgi:hypothetical protein
VFFYWSLLAVFREGKKAEQAMGQAREDQLRPNHALYLETVARHNVIFVTTAERWHQEEVDAVIQFYQAQLEDQAQAGPSRPRFRFCMTRFFMTTAQ